MMRVRVFRRPKGEIDGIALEHFQAGAVYDLNASLGTYLVVQGWAEAVPVMATTEKAPMDFTRGLARTVKRLADETATQRARKNR